MPTIEEMIEIVQVKYSNAKNMDIVSLKEKYEEVRDESRSHHSDILTNLNEPRGEEYDGGNEDNSSFSPVLVIFVILLILFLIFILGQPKPNPNDWNRGY